MGLGLIPGRTATFRPKGGGHESPLEFLRRTAAKVIDERSEPSRPDHPCRPPAPKCLGFECLEQSQLLTTFTVDNTYISGAGSLRQAIVDADNSAGAHTIDCEIPGTGVHKILPTSALSPISDPVTIDGYTQSGASPNTKPHDQGDDAALRIEINGSAAGNTAVGLTITAGDSTGAADW